MKDFETLLDKWHEFVQTKNAEILDEIFADEIKFHSPFVWKPKEGKLITKAIIFTVMEVFQNFKYIREVIENENAVLEFEAEIDGLKLRGVDLIKFNENGEIEDFEVMIRPANALQKLGEKMSKKLSEKGLI